MVVDVSTSDSTSTRALNALLATRNRLLAHGGRMAVVVSPRNRRRLGLLGLDRRFVLAADRRQALERLGHRRRRQAPARAPPSVSRDGFPGTLAGMAGVRPRGLPARYEDVELVARGGMADVYRARDSVLGRVVAVKVLADRYAADEDFRARFTREALTAASLSHPNVVTIFDVGEPDGTPFIVMEHLGGGSLADRLRDGRVPHDTAIAWLDQAAGALDAAHAAGIVHRDVKPANLMLDDEGDVHVADFGIARAAAHDPLTSAGTILGSSGYMAPEQARGEPATAASDRYALGCVAFELLTGRRPFEADSPTAEAMLHASEPPPHPSDVEPSLPAAVDTVLLRALAKSPDARPPSARRARERPARGAAGGRRAHAPHRHFPCTTSRRVFSAPAVARWRSSPPSWRWRARARRLPSR